VRVREWLLFWAIVLVTAATIIGLVFALNWWAIPIILISLMVLSYRYI